MLQGIACKHLIAIVTIYIVIVFTAAFVVNTDSSVRKSDHLLLGIHHQDTEDYLSFLDGFVFGDVLESQVDSATIKKKIVKRSTSEVTAPRYMLDVYEFLSDRRHHVKFDTARSFHSSNYVAGSANVPGALKLKDRTLYPIIFNVSHFPQSETVLFAQIRIQELHGEIVGYIGSRKIELYSSSPSSLNELASKYFNPTTQSLLTMNVTEAFQKAMDSNKKQLHFRMSIPNEFLSLMSLDPGTVEGPQLLVLSKSAHKKEHGEDMILNRMRRSLKDAIPELSKSIKSVKENDTSLERIFNKTEVDSINSIRRRQRRSEEEDEEAEEQSNYIVEELGRIRKGKLKRKKNPCRRKPLHVNFAAINYDQWIIAPPTYEAFECTGRCSFPMSAHLAPTKHAIIQTLMHSLEPKQVSRACCVPIKLEPMSILYVEDDGTVTFKYDYEDMVVAECGCR